MQLMFEKFQFFFSYFSAAASLAYITGLVVHAP
jgi:hypothetical protein